MKFLQEGLCRLGWGTNRRKQLIARSGASLLPTIPSQLSERRGWKQESPRGLSAPRASWDWLPVQAERELHHSWIPRERCYRCCASAAYVSARLSEQRVVGDIEHLPPGLGIPALMDG